MYSIEVKSLSKHFGKFVSVDNISFKVKDGEIFGFLGANGAGKSTTIKMLCGILEPTSGDALIGGYSVVREPEKVKQTIGYMSQRFSLYNDLSVIENIYFFGGIYGLEGTALEERKKWVLEISNLIGRENDLTGILPGGVKQRLALGVAVIHKPKIVFLDEPTSGVDPISRRAFWDLIQNLSTSGITVFVTTHYLEEAEYCGNIIFIDAGKLVAEGNPAKLKTEIIKDPILEIESSNPVSFMGILSKQDFAEEVTLFGNNIHLTLRDSYKESVNKEILQLLSSDIEIIRVNPIIPTLEDVFINLLEKK